MTHPLRCVVYTRKSSEEGLDQEFNSLDAQREACEAYIKSQAAEGWKLNRKRYDDGGYSGGTMERPALQDLLEDIQRGLVDIVVVYKIDRLSRSLADFARLVELFENHDVTFVSVTQHFNTTTSMGRLTLNVLLSFAQFEREITGERIRDKIAASKKKGLWMGGTVPIGYDLKDHKLVVNEREAQHVRLIFNTYLELGTVSRLAQELNRLGMRSKERVGISGVRTGGCTFLRGQLYTLLKNHTYIGEIAHKGHVYNGEHEAIVARNVWDEVQTLLTKNRRKDQGRRSGNPQYVLTGLLYDDRGHPMTPHHTQKRGKLRYSYYVSQAIIQQRRDEAGSVARVAVREIESAVEQAVGPRMTAAQRAEWGAGNAAVRRDVLRELVQRIELRPTELAIELNELSGSENNAEENLHVVVTFVPRKRGRQKQIHLAPGQGEAMRTISPAIRDAIVRAWTWRQWFETDEVRSLAQAAKREGCNEAYVRRLLPMAFLAPDIIEAAVDGSLSRHLTIADLAAHDMPLSWESQRSRLGLAS